MAAQTAVAAAQGFLAYDPTAAEEDEVARVSLPNEVWNKGAAAANASLYDKT
jgi:hypothetical protein